MNGRLRNPYVWAFVVGCAVVTLIRPLLRRVPPPPPVTGQLPRFSLVSSRGDAFGSESLAGHVYVASLFFTRCAPGCDQLMRGISRLGARYRDENLDSIRLVSITVDPTYDTPERLREAETRWAVDPARWLLLTGPLDEIHALARQGFGVALGPAPSAADLADAKLFLVDGRGGLRGRYGSDDLGLDEVFWRSRRVAEEERGRAPDTRRGEHRTSSGDENP